ncbi:FHA domain-containing protein DDL isoform X2 [Manihot esculenta]|nr:FHA domain-containing protein DDL isoform X2 [Manihot esculenta]XP_021608070.1 FHA domain-containing protein DDL isoform X2 [Manihot esculenta]XP_021608071.1 FHA domain-containing protein DDL isoform X2 [Manihot esculenta]
MGRNLSSHSQSPIRGRGSPHRKSPSRRERSPARHRSSHRDISPAREKRSTRTRSPKHEMYHSSSPPRHRSSQRDSSPQAREKNYSHEKSQSPSPRTKRLRRAQAERETEPAEERDHERNRGKGDDKGTRGERETGKLSGREREKSHGKGGKGAYREREAEKLTEREHEKNHGRVTDRNTHRERGEDRDGAERMERRSGKDATDSKSYRARNGRSTSPSDHHHRNKHRSRSPQRDGNRRERDEVTNSRGAERRNDDDDDDDSVAKMKAAEEALEAKQKQQPSFELSGKLAAETNRVRGVTLLFNEPPDARKPDIRWRLYVFKNGEVLNEPLYIHRQTCYLFGRERRVADIPTDHPSCSKQHAVIQFRQVEKDQPDGTISKQPRICTIAREFSRLMGVDLHLEVVITSSSSGRCRSILLVYNTCVLRNRIPLFSGDFAVIKIGQILYQMWSFSYYNATLFNAHQLFAMLAFQAEVTRTESLVHFHTSPFLLQFYLFIYFSIIIIFIS